MAKKQETETEAPRALTDYVVLRRWTPKVFEESDFAREVVDQLQAALGETWQPVSDEDGAPRVFTAASKSAAIRQHTGDGADVIEGTWKAVPVSSWKGGEVTKRVTATERLPLEDAVS